MTQLNETLEHKPMGEEHKSTGEALERSPLAVDQRVRPMGEPLIPYEDMLKAGMHFGRKKAVYNPAMAKYVFTVRDGICIIDLLKTQEKLQVAIEFLKKSLEEGRLVLFVAATKQAQEGTQRLADMFGMPFVMDRWLGGVLTNFKILNARVKRLEELEKQRATGEFEKYTKKERLMMERELEKMNERFGGLRKLTRIPDIMFVSSVKEGKLPIAEARRMGVKLIGIVNTDADPADVEYAIPANERSKVSVDLILNVIARELESVKKTA
ncbi:MAG: 30S ribosomal protein S2 [Candidatus Yanofskybacteria bacterium]|nr:30S ribosomal protein S2 [Candidatus Yanofskybacteria bacterium]